MKSAGAKYFTALLSAVSIAVVPLIGLSQEKLPGGDELPADRIVDFGRITEGDEPAGKFSFTNETVRKLKIISIRIPCGCAKTKSEKQELEPGEKTEFEVTLLTKGLRGSLKKSIYLVTDLEEMKAVQFRLVAEIAAKPHAVCVAPTTLDAGEMRPDGKKKLILDIENRGELELEISPGTTDKSLKLLKEPPFRIAPGKKETVEMEFTAPAYGGRTKANLMFTTNDPAREKLWIYVTADVKSEK